MVGCFWESPLPLRHASSPAPTAVSSSDKTQLAGDSFHTLNLLLEPHRAVSCAQHGVGLLGLCERRVSRSLSPAVLCRMRSLTEWRRPPFVLGRGPQRYMQEAPASVPSIPCLDREGPFPGTLESWRQSEQPQFP